MNKVLHFSDGFSLDDINNVLSSKDGILYYTRQISEKNEFHIINHKDGTMTITPFITQLLNYYNTNKQTQTIIRESKVKGNEKFAIITNTNQVLIEQLKKDLNILLKK
jgi:hypothetical protein